MTEPSRALPFQSLTVSHKGKESQKQQRIAEWYALSIPRISLPLTIPQAAPYEEGAPILFSNTMPPTDAPATVTRVESSGDPDKHIGPDNRPGTGSIDSFPGLCSPSGSPNRPLSTRSTILDHGVTEKTRSHADTIVGASKPRSQGEAPRSKKLLGFCRSLFHHDSYYAYLSFLRAYPEYKLTRSIDTLREREYKRLKRSGEVYVDYMGAALYPETLIRSDAAFLRWAVLGNTHSFSNRYARKFYGTR